MPRNFWAMTVRKVSFGLPMMGLEFLGAGCAQVGDRPCFGQPSVQGVEFGSMILVKAMMVCLLSPMMGKGRGSFCFACSRLSV